MDKALAAGFPLEPPSWERLLLRQVSLKKPPGSGHFDVFFKSGFSHPRHALELLRAAFSEKEFDAFDWDTLELVSGSFPKAIADLVFAVSLKGLSGELFRLCLLVEHKSQYRSEIFYQSLKYKTLILGRRLEEAGKPWPILAVVFYNGERAWKERSFRKWSLGAAEIAKKVPLTIQRDVLECRLRVLDARGAWADRVIRDSRAETRGFLSALRHGRSFKADAAQLKEAIGLFDSWRGDKGDLLLSAGDYFWSVVPGMTEELWEEVEREGVNRGIFKKGGYMNIRERIKEEGRQEGWQKGWQKGWRDRDMEVISNMLQEKFDISAISKATGLPKAKIIKFKNGGLKNGQAE